MIIPSVNFHLWEPCNMRCKFCFATFQDVKKSILPKGHLPKQEALRIVDQLAQFGFEKITFAGGEPTLCPWLPELLQRAKQHGLTTMIVTNGTALSEEYLGTIAESTDWIALSIDSLCSKINLKSGRAKVGKKALDELTYLAIIERVISNGIKLKINTVVHALNYEEDMNEFINRVQPLRWKVLQVLPIEGQNSGSVNPFLITKSQFNEFVLKHKGQSSLVPEANEDIKGSYVMVDPAGRFFQNEEAQYAYSLPILQHGVERAYKQMNYDYKLFQGRGGDYTWD